MLMTTDLTVRYGARTVLTNTEFRAEPGEFCAIVGPNGSGKTTLLRALTGEVPFAGRVEINGTDIMRRKPWELAAIRAVLPQSTTLSFPFQVIEIVRLGLRSGASGTEAHVALRALERVGLAGYAERFYQELSGGEQQRVQLARVLCQVWNPVEKGVPRWMLLDEPVSSLDIGHQLQVLQIARDFADAGGGVVAVMHDLNLSAIFADRVVLMAAGRIVSTGSAADVLTDVNLSAVYGCAVRANTVPKDAGWFYVPHVAEVG